MTAEVLDALIRLNLAVSALIVPILFLRHPVRRLCGPRLACRMWLILLIAAWAVIASPRTDLYTDPWVAGLGRWAGLAVGVWLAGVCACLVLLAAVHLRILARARRGEVGPAVVGLFSPRVYLPSGFEAAYTPAEQAVMRAHERAHLLRGDATANALMALVQCLLWFNPLVHLAATRLRRDQEMACDATVMEERPETRRLYAETMLKTQLRQDMLPLGCGFVGVHPLEERIAALLARRGDSGREVIGAVCLCFAAVLVVGAGIALYSSLNAWTPEWL